ncbi:MAG: WD40 repeat domain-containing protein, partial [Desulfosarcinaceae bacterium]|nr:WD40 repeat domain-containing protein [Desulfosarcinaceae bacterium]
MTPTQMPPNPYVGLRPFESRDSVYYFGRAEQTKALLRQLHRHRFVAVVGSSGTGKSSLVRAGLIPNLEAGFLVQDRDLWHIAVMKPGVSPRRNLAAALAEAVGTDGPTSGAGTLLNAIRARGALGILDTLGPALTGAEANLLLVVDQFEELFREGRMETGEALEAAADFVGILLHLARQTKMPVHVCLTMRSDFLGECDRFSGLPEAMNQSQYLVPRLTRDQRRQAIEGPARLGGATVAPRLLDRLLNEDIGTRDDLPILQHALMRTWEMWSQNGSGPIDSRHYEAVGTVREALSRHADEALEELGEADRELTRRFFQAITTTDAANRQVRRQARLNEVAAICGCDDAPERIMAVIDRFRQGGRNFIVLSSKNIADDPLIDISHESLIRQWPTLRNWAKDEAEAAGIYRRLADAARRHSEEKASLYRDADLEVALQWEAESRPTSQWAERYAPGYDVAISFLVESRREREEKEHRRKRALRNATLVSLVMIVTAITACWLGWQAFKQQKRAEAKRLEANYNLAKVFEEKALDALAKALSTNDTGQYQRAFLYATEALAQEIPSDQDALKPASIGLLMDPLNIKKALPCRWFSPSSDHRVGAVRAVSFSPDGRTLVSGSEDNTVRLWDAATGEALQELKGHTGYVWSVSFSPDGQIIASGSADKTMRIWDAATGEAVLEIKGHTGSVRSVSFSPDGQTLVSGSEDNTVRLWDAATGEALQEL